MRDLHCSVCGDVIAIIENYFGIGKVICINCDLIMEEEE